MYVENVFSLNSASQKFDMRGVMKMDKAFKQMTLVGTKSNVQGTSTNS